MIRKIGGYIESKTGVYVYPRFVISVIALTIALILFGATFFAVRKYRESVQTISPSGGAASVEYGERMRAGLLPPSARQ